MLLLIHPKTGTAITAKSREEFKQLIEDGFKPVGPRGSERARQILAAAAKTL